jgi:hypothetical protein
MVITTKKESNFPNSRMKAEIQGEDINNPGQLLKIQAEQVAGVPNKRALMVQIAQAAGNPLQTTANITSYQGMSSFNMSNAFIPEGYNDVQLVETATENFYRHYKDATYIASIKITYVDATKKKATRFQRVVEVIP